MRLTPNDPVLIRPAMLNYFGKDIGNHHGRFAMKDDLDNLDEMLDIIKNGKLGKEISPDPHNLEWVLRSTPWIEEKVKSSEAYAGKLYGALCNNRFNRDNVFDLLNDRYWWSCSWRYAGGIVADIIGRGDYLDWYCTGGEGYVDPEIAADLQKLGWTWAPT